VHGRDAGVALVLDPAVTAVGFTGSERGARALMRAMEARDIPIPFYGELGSINPVVVLPGAAAARATELGHGLALSATSGAGQFCTKPGVALVPVGADGDAVVDAAASAFAATVGAVMLTPGIADAYRRGSSELVATAGVRERARGQEGNAAPAPLLLEVPAGVLAGRLVEECFGPVCLVARYDDVASLPELLGGLPASLTATLHHDAGADEPSAELLDTLAQVAGRVLFNGFPTGVAVTWAQTHTGGWPASNSLHTSVGPTAVRRFMRPVTWQDAPTSALPEELRDDTVDIPRRVDGTLVVPRRPTAGAS
jgi:NADP-dependent aldehyde dehydrogenase